MDEARRKAEVAHAEAGVAEEDFSVMGQDKTPPPQPLPDPEVQGYIDFEGRKKSLMGPLVVGLAILGGVAFMLGNILGTASSEHDIRNGFIDEARDVYDAVATSKSKGSEETKLERWVALQESLGQLADRLQDLTAGYMGANANSGIGALVDDEAKAARVALIVQRFADMIPKLKALKRDKVFFSASGLVGESVRNPVLMAKVMDFGAKSEAFHEALIEELAQLQEFGDAYVGARMEFFRRGLAAEFKPKRLYSAGVKEPIVLKKWTVAKEDDAATEACSAVKANLKKSEKCVACCKAELKADVFDVSFEHKKRCICERESEPRELCRDEDKEAGLAALPCPTGYTCEDGKCAADLRGAMGHFVTLQEDKIPRMRDGRWERRIVMGNEIHDAANFLVAKVDWDGVSKGARNAYAKELLRAQQQAHLKALSTLSSKVNKARWYGKGGLREFLVEWACKTGESGAPKASLDCEGAKAKERIDALNSSRDGAKRQFETDAQAAEAKATKQGPSK